MKRWILPALIPAFIGLISCAGPETGPGKQPSLSPAETPGAEKPAAAGAAAAVAGGPEVKEKGKKEVPEKKASEAELIADLNRSMEDDQQTLAALQANLENPQSEYKKAEAEFQQLDKDYEARQTEIQKLEGEGEAAEVNRLKEQLADLEKKRNLSKDRFDLAIQERKALTEKIAALEQKIQQDRQALDTLSGAAQAAQAAEPKAAAGAPAAPTTPRTAAAAKESAAPPAPETGSAPAAAPAAAPATATAAAPTAAPAAPAAKAEGQPGTGAPGAAPPPPAAGEPKKTEKPPSEALVKAQKEAEKKGIEAKQAEVKAQTVADTVEVRIKNIEAEQKLLDTHRKEVENATATVQSLEEEIQKKNAEGAPAASIAESQSKLAEARTRQSEAQAKVKRSEQSLSRLKAELADIEASQKAVKKVAEEKQKEAESAQRKVAYLENPFAPHNLFQWLLSNGPKLAAIILAMILAQWLTRLICRRIITLVARSVEQASPEDRENRARTLVGVFQNTATVLIYIFGILMGLQVVNLPIAPLLGGAAIGGLAVAFGAQKLIRDYFHGFVILLENQYGINDVVQIAGVAGKVERITLRMTVLRDLEGVVHFIPNGEITTVSNRTHTWSRAVFDVGVAYKEDADRVMEAIAQVGKEMRRDPIFGPLILDDLTMLGLDAFADSAIVIKFFIQTRPLKQWDVKREMLRRLKRRFDELGIEIPFPHRTIYHRYEDAFAPSEAALGPNRLPREERAAR